MPSFQLLLTPDTRPRTITSPRPRSALARPSLIRLRKLTTALVSGPRRLEDFASRPWPGGFLACDLQKREKTETKGKSLTPLARARDLLAISRPDAHFSFLLC